MEDGSGKWEVGSCHCEAKPKQSLKVITQIKRQMTQIKTQFLVICVIGFRNLCNHCDEVAEKWAKKCQLITKC